MVLTKPLGSGYLATAIKREDLTESEVLRVMEWMALLNKAASEAMVEVGVHSATDITGFGLTGHACGMADGAGVTLRFRGSAIPRMEGVEAHMTKRNTCGGLRRNASYGDAPGRVKFASDVSEESRLLASDPQTSGGLLIAVAPERLSTLLKALERRGVATRAVVGEVVARTEAAVEFV